MNSKVVNGLIISIMASMGMVGCGGDSDSNDGVYGSNSDTGGVLVGNLFDSKYNPNTNSVGIKRIQWKFSNGNRELVEKDIVGVNLRGGLDNDDSVVLASNFESELAKRNIKVEGHTITYPMKALNSDRTETYSIELQEVDLSGIDRSSFNSRDYTGIYTDLVEYDQIPNTTSFPAGSVCYVIKQTSSIPFFNFRLQNDATDFDSLQAWTRAYSTVTVSNNALIRAEEMSVGTMNQYPVVRLIFETDPREEYLNYNAINYENTIYMADFVHNSSVSENMDPNAGIVDCSLINDIAAEFLEDQILQHYS